MSDVVITDATERARYELCVDGELAGIATYRLVGSNLAILHTEIDPTYEGRGLGSRFARHMLDDARQRGLGVLPYCPFIAQFISTHGEYLDLVPEARRGQFGL